MNSKTIASKRSIGKQMLFVSNQNGTDIPSEYVVKVKPKSAKLTKLQKKHKLRKASHKARMYNYLHK